MSAVAALFFATHAFEKTAVVFCIVAALLDAFDGWYARTFSQCSKLGKHLDPLADKLLMAVVYTLIAIKMRSAAVWVLISLVAIREIGMTLIRAYSVRRHKKFIPANRWGKVKMVLQSTFGVVLIYYATFLNGGYDFARGVVVVPLIVILIISYYSAIIYINTWRKTISTFEREQVVGVAEAPGDVVESGRMVVGE
jgi:CDP-diacylglycerol--glycerol-3-phosphate 3-phosphatidyltransferase